MNIYTSIFRKSKIKSVTRYGEAGAEVSGRPKRTVMTVTFELEGRVIKRTHLGAIGKRVSSGRARNGPAFLVVHISMGNRQPPGSW